MSIKSIKVDALFGRFDYHIPISLPLGMTPGLLIITAPNGYGKSTILRLLNDVAHGDYANVARTNFKRFAIEGDASITLVVETISRAEKERISGASAQAPAGLRFSLIDEESGVPLQDPWELEIRARFEPDEEDRIASRYPMSMIEREFPFLRRIGPAEWRDVRSGTILSRPEIVRLMEARGSHTRGLTEDDPNWLADFRTKLKVLYISANRLRAEVDARGARPYRSANMVEVWADRVREQIRDVIRRYAERGRALERTFPSRIISAMRGKAVGAQEEVAALVEKVRSKEARYQALGLVGAGQTVEIEENLSDLGALVVLKTYLEDISSKFEALDSAAERLDIFQETINSMLLFKRVRLSADAGFEIVSEDGGDIPPGSLSSGEQHLVVLLGELVFGPNEGTTILLDEPEISFHPEWQERFPKVLTRIIEINDCSIVMATHSPTLIQDNWDSVVELADQVRK